MVKDDTIALLLASCRRGVHTHPGGNFASLLECIDLLGREDRLNIKEVRNLNHCILVIWVKANAYLNRYNIAGCNGCGTPTRKDVGNASTELLEPVLGLDANHHVVSTEHLGNTAEYDAGHTTTHCVS